MIVEEQRGAFWLILTYRFRLYPTFQQSRRLCETIKTGRRLYNTLFDDRIKTHTKAFEQNRASTVKPRGTSQECSGSGKTVEKKLSVRTHSCPYCGLELDRDVNAARNILAAKGLEQANAETEPLPLLIRIGNLRFSQGSKKPIPFTGG
jgi:transposase